jgi:hypothetical protein
MFGQFIAIQSGLTPTSSLLLDVFPNANSAFSLRKLRNKYSGPCIRVRRASDNAQRDIYFNSNLSVDTNAIAYFCGASNGFVSVWFDQSGNNKFLQMDTGTNQPQIYNGSAVLLESGKPTLYFDGVDNYMECLVAGNTGFGTPPVYSAVVLRVLETGVFGGIVTSKVAGAEGAPAQFYTNTNKYSISDGIYTAESTTSIGGYDLFTANWETTGPDTKRLFINGVKESDTSFNYSVAHVTGNTMGLIRGVDTTFGKINIQEWVFWNVQLSDAQNLVRSDEINSYYGMY